MSEIWQMEEERRIIPAGGGGVDNNLFLIQSNWMANGSTSFTDSSSYSRSITFEDIYHTTSRYKFNGSSMLATINGTLIMDEIDLSAMDDLTFDVWLWPSVDNFNIRFFSTGYLSDYFLILTRSNTNKIQLYSTDGLNVSSTASVVSGSWYHIALVHTAGAWSLYINGIKDFSVTHGNIQYTGNSLSRTHVGRLPGQTAYGWKGYIEEARLSNEATWTSNFTPPTSPY